MRKVNYKVTYNRNTKQRAVVVNGEAHLVSKKNGQWYAKSLYHPTLRDAIVYIVYGL